MASDPDFKFKDHSKVISLGLHQHHLDKCTLNFNCPTFPDKVYEDGLSIMCFVCFVCKVHSNCIKRSLICLFWDGH